jgi:hypothetical protein
MNSTTLHNICSIVRIDNRIESRDPFTVMRLIFTNDDGQPYQVDVYSTQRVEIVEVQS